MKLELFLRKVSRSGTMIIRKDFTPILLTEQFVQSVSHVAIGHSNERLMASAFGPISHKAKARTSRNYSTDGVF
uniref:Uncharacterized protein n=1 Tax=Syphacia muris TaxID=451379 RepID=A0A0N5AMP8_9BILA